MTTKKESARIMTIPGTHNANSGKILRDNVLSDHKDNIYRTQLQIIHHFFKYNTTTMHDAEQRTGVCRPSICRYVRDLEDRGLIDRLYQDNCPISGFKAWYFGVKERSEG